ncbi:type II toxin-antitoxin system HicB family antitoxin [candidate division TA06 bacterium]|uniref:Type II toxin-antitoxin system HicB family antitoxin n=1 Tax=candidate division TA06 bacterium TaxID=2250710 RepID=A0A933MHX9_UNCT6|nr:type II toxin-antitoxin system HicB family antitoxin [candidate division TA06 bacterium]
MNKYFTLAYWIDDGWYVGRIREIPGIFSQGETLDELKENIKEAYNLMLQEDKAAAEEGFDVKELELAV